MTGCDGELLSRYVDGELNANQAREVADHLATCARCKENYAMLTSLHALSIETLPRTRFPRATVPMRHRLIGRGAAAAAAAVFLLVAGGLIWTVYRGYFAKPPTPPMVASAPVSPKPAPPPLAVSLPEETEDDSEPTVLEQPTPLPYEPPPLSPRSVQGIVTDKAGSPLANARVEIRRWEGSAAETAAIAYTDGAGRFTVEYPEDSSRLRIYKRGFDPVVATFRGGIRGAEVEVHASLTPSEVVTGTVVGERGEPVPGAVVYGSPDALDGFGPQTRTDGSGRFRIPAKAFALWVEHPDYAPTYVGEGTDEAAVTLRLRRGGGLMVTVLHAAGRPVSGARVQVQGGHGVLPKAPEATTDAAGQASFENLPPAGYVLTARTPQGSLASRSATVRAGEVVQYTLHLTGEYPGTLRGQVVDEDGLPLAGARVHLTNADYPMGSREVHVADDGAIEAGLEFGATQVSVSPYRFWEWECVGEPRRTFTVASDREHFFEEFRFRPLQPFMVAMVDEDDNPVTKAYVVADNCLYDWWGGVRFLLAAPEGRFELHAQNVSYLAAHDPESQRAGLATWRPGQERVLTVRMTRPTGAIAGRVAEPDGTPVAGVWLLARRQARDELMPHATAHSDPAGRFELAPLDLNSGYFVHVQRRGYDVVSAPEGLVTPASVRDPLAIVMARKEAVIAGTVVYADGVPVVNALVTVERDEERIDGVKTDGAGAFRVALAPGMYAVQATVGNRGLQTPWESVEAPAEDVVLILPVDAPPEVPPEGLEHEQARHALKQMGLVFKMFANETEGVYPALDNTFGAFRPDSASIYPEYLADEVIMARITGQQEVKTCYLGYAVDNETVGLAFLDAYEQYGPEGLASQDVSVEDGFGTGGGETLYRLREGIERFLITDINDPQASAMTQARIPLLWEVPGDRGEPGGWVLYMDGHVEWEPYPGQFPMTEAFIERVRELMSD